MAALSKFLFDTDFDAGGDPLSARPTVRPDTRRFTATEVEAAKAAAHAEGLAAGRAAAEQEIGRRDRATCLQWSAGGSARSWQKPGEPPGPDARGRADGNARSSAGSSLPSPSARR